MIRVAGAHSNLERRAAEMRARNAALYGDPNDASERSSKIHSLNVNKQFLAQFAEEDRKFKSKVKFSRRSDEDFYHGLYAPAFTYEMATIGARAVDARARRQPGPRSL